MITDIKNILPKTNPMKIDAHQHFWNYDPVQYNWIDEEMAILKRDYLPSELAQTYQNNGIQGCISVQANQTEAETHFLLELASQNDFIGALLAG